MQFHQKILIKLNKKKAHKKVPLTMQHCIVIGANCTVGTTTTTMANRKKMAAKQFGCVFDSLSLLFPFGTFWWDKSRRPRNKMKSTLKKAAATEWNKCAPNKFHSMFISSKELCQQYLFHWFSVCIQCLFFFTLWFYFFCFIHSLCDYSLSFASYF